MPVTLKFYSKVRSSLLTSFIGGKERQDIHIRIVSFVVVKGPGKPTYTFSAFRNDFPLSAFRPNVTFAWYQQAGEGVESGKSVTFGGKRIR